MSARKIYTMSQVSVVVPVYNVEKYLRKCLDGILSQTLKDIEVIVVDDGSTDSSLSILREYEKKDGRVQVVSRQNGGAGAARNTGLELAKGRYLFFHDPDDFSSPQMLERLVANAERYNSDVVVAGRKLYDNVTASVIKEVHLPKHVISARQPFDYRDVADRFFASFGFAPWNKLFRRDFIADAGLRFQEIPRTNDMYFVNVALVSARRISALDEALYYYRMNVKSSLQANNDKTPLMFFKSWNAIRMKLVEQNILESVYRSYAFAALTSSIQNLLSLRSEYNFRLVYDRLRREIFPTLFGRRLTSVEVPNADWFEQYNILMDNESPVLFMMARNRFDQKVQQNLNKTIAQNETETAKLVKRAKENALERAARAESSLRAAHKTIDLLGSEMSQLRNSESYRVGMVVTWPARKVWGGVKCLRENGFGYTMKHAAGKALRMFGLKSKW